MSSPGFIGKWMAASPYLKSVLRIVTGFLFILLGTIKLFNFPMPMPPEAGPLNMMSQIGIGGILEVVGGALIILGLFTRPTAFILSGEMAVAYFQFHAPAGLWPVVNGGTDAIIFCFIFLYFSSSGAGPWSLDALRSSVRRNSAEEREQVERYKKWRAEDHK